MMTSNQYRRTLEMEEMTNKSDGTSETGNMVDINPSDTVPVFRNMRSTTRRRFAWERMMIVAIFVTVLLLLLLICILLAVVSKYKVQVVVINGTVPSNAETPCLSFTCLQAAVDIIKSLNTSVDPCVDFSEYVCGSWVNDHMLPKGNSRYSTFDVVNKELYKIQKKMLENSQFNNDQSTHARAVRLYESCLDMETLNSLGAKPLLEYIDKLHGKYGGWEMLPNNTAFDINKWSLQAVCEDPNVETPIFKLQVQEDNKNSSRNIFNVHLTWQLLEKQYLQNSTKPENFKIIDAYKKYMRDIGKLFGIPSSKFEMFDKVFQLEIEAALKYPREEDQRDPDSMYNKMTLSALQSQICPLFNWTNIVRKKLQLVNLTLVDNMEVIVPSPENLKTICLIFDNYTKTPEKKLILHNYVIWRLVSLRANFLSEDFNRVKDKFHRVYYGTTGSKERWEQCVSVVQTYMGPVIGNMYVTQHFNKDSKPQVSEMIKLLKEKFRYNLLHINKWMDQSTTNEAITKINNMWPIIGYTDSILNMTFLEEYYKDIEVNNNSFFDNVDRLNERSRLKILDKIFKIPENSSIEVPQEVNAFYNPNKNEIIFPAGILQNPFFEPGFLRSLKYGGIGTAMGHEITHGFDDTGSKYDARGDLRSWWSNKTRQLFKNKSDCFVKQYSAYSLFGYTINGENTLGENIADNGGVRLTYQVFKDLEKKYGVEKPLPGLNYTQDQLFFITFARLWCNLQTRQSTLIDIFSNSHTPNKFRVIGTLSNIQEFADAFNCPVGSPMNPADKCLIW